MRVPPLPRVRRHDARLRSGFSGLQERVVEASIGLVPDITELRDAAVVPARYRVDRNGKHDVTAGRPGLSGGVVTRQGGVAASSHVEGGVALMIAESRRIPRRTPTISGRWLYLGLAAFPFSHFIAESLGRVWALDADIGHVDGVVLIAEPGQTELTPANAAILAAVTSLPVIVASSALRFEEIVVPRQESNGSFGLVGTPRLLATLRSRLAPGAQIESEILFVSRAGLAANPTGRILASTALEDHLRSSGATVLRPETRSVDHQLRAYRGARTIIVEEGGPIPAIAASAASDATVIVLARRPWYSLVVGARLELSLGHSATIRVIDAPGPLLRVEGYPQGLWQRVDFPALQRLLASHLPRLRTPPWPAQSVTEYRADASTVEAALGSRFSPFVPLASAL